MDGNDSRREHFLSHILECEAVLRAFIAGASPVVEDRADIFQDVVMVLWRNFDRYDATRPFQPWAVGVAVRRMKEEYRRRLRRAECLEPEKLERLAAVLNRQTGSEGTGDEEAALAECLNMLPPQSARLVRARYYEGAGIEALGIETGQSPAAIYQMLSRIRQRLAECIRQRLYRPKTQPVITHEL